MIMSKKGYLFIILIAFGHSLAAQKEEKISVSVTSTPFPAFVKLLEEKTTTRFYYNQTNLDSFFVTVDATELTLADILQKSIRQHAVPISDTFRKPRLHHQGNCYPAGTAGRFF